MSQFTVSKAVPFPKTIRPNVKVKRKYPYEELEVGDCFFIPGREKNTLSTHNSNVGKKLGRKFRAKLCWMRKGADGSWELSEEGAAGAVFGLGVWRFPDPVNVTAGNVEDADTDEDEDADDEIVEDDDED